MKDSVQLHGDKNWDEIADLVPGRTKHQCRRRWHDALDPSISRENGRRFKWTEDEDVKLKGSVQLHGGKNWAVIVDLVSGRTKVQCRRRWHDALHPSIDLENGRTGTWTEGEDIKLLNAVELRDGKDWAAISALIPGRTKVQCRRRRHDALDPSVDRENGRTGKWTEDEVLKMKESVQQHGGKNWAAIVALVSGRTRSQCCNRWHDALDPSIDLEHGRTGTWTEGEDIKLLDAIQIHGGKYWDKIAGGRVLLVLAIVRYYRMMMIECTRTHGSLSVKQGSTASFVRSKEKSVAIAVAKVLIGNIRCASTA
jgi:hypothetical protein